MKKHLRLKMLLLAVISLFLYSCMHDETTAESEASYLTKEYTSKSLWKEDEKYIKNVKKIFEANADPEYFKNKHGEVAWNYALTTGEESLLEVPVIKNGKIYFTLVVKREGNRVYFKTDPNEKSKKFFEILMFKDRKNLSGSLKETSKDPQARSACITITKTVTWTDTVTGEVLQIDHFTETRCSPVGPYLDCTDLSLNSSCGSGSGGDSGGGGGDGYSYPGSSQDQQFFDNCGTLKRQAMNIDFKDKVIELDKPAIFNKNQETGYAAAYGPKTSYESLANTDNDNLKLPPGNKYFGYMHVHLNKEGVVKIFSPADIFTFLTGCVRNAEQKGTMEDAYAMVITSQGNYMLKYSGDGNYGVGPNTLASWNKWYTDKYERLTESDLSKPSLIEKIFVQFLEEKVKIEGLELFKTNTVAASAEKLTLGSDKNTVESIKCP
ncbi:hypothetical protein OK18_06825 [Chryseobacterium gallinarum]|uniref:Lipoprotein n=1 Tax=Chryseobacterium gallinarum TaxID=1324352 RepID=A0A0G3M167_CHRGL|nr:hypothetical protein [Chryseobacterium gallinarum]AKK72385.1 hypothetical protein OK18_06825 [Chryseobacterium gallinarum]